VRSNGFAENSQTRQCQQSEISDRREEKTTMLRLVQTEKTAKPAANKPPRRKPIAGRKHITPEEFDTWRKAVRDRSSYPDRDALLITIMFRHGLRVSEAVRLTWEDVNLSRVGTVMIRRAKHGRDGTHNLDGDELRMLRAVQRLRHVSRFIFTTKRGSPMSERTARHILTSAAKDAGLPVTNPHALRHGTGYRLIRKGTDLRRVQEFMGHRDIKSTTIYTALDSSAVAGLERD
jgi:type 1 fimbriae regulatory protein FimB